VAHSPPQESNCSFGMSRGYVPFARFRWLSFALPLPAPLSYSRRRGNVNAFVRSRAPTSRLQQILWIVERMRALRSVSIALLAALAQSTRPRCSAVVFRQVACYLLQGASAVAPVGACLNCFCEHFEYMRQPLPCARWRMSMACSRGRIGMSTLDLLLIASSDGFVPHLR
jgi:hypothetical protein